MLVDMGCTLETRDVTGDDGSRHPLGAFVPLIHAIVHQGSTSLVRKMLQRGAPAECHTEDGKTALMYAAELGASQILADLIQFGADVTKEQPGGEKWTALMYAARHGNRSACRVLMGAMGIRPPDAKKPMVADEVNGVEMDAE
jgi:hypothetical protein